MSKNVKFYDNQIFAQRFRTLMGKTNATLQDIALLTGCAVSTASTWKRGRLPRNYETLEKIADFFGVDADYLAGRDVEIFSNELKTSKSENFTDILKKKFDDLIKKSKKDKSKLNLIRKTLDDLEESI